MRKFGIVTLLVGTMAMGLFFFAKSDEAVARMQYKKEFESTYPKVNNGKITCNACHIGKERKDRNDYGKALAKALKKVNDDKDLPKTGLKEKEKIKEALEAVAKDEAKFGDRIKEGKLPVE